MFDPDRVRVPFWDDLTIEDHRRMTPGQKWDLIGRTWQYVRQAHYYDFMQRNPWAYPNDVLMDWAIIAGIDKIVPADEFARRMADVPVIMPVSCSSPVRQPSQDDGK